MYKKINNQWNYLSHGKLKLKLKITNKHINKKVRYKIRKYHI